jgi:NAD+ kinase
VNLLKDAAGQKMKSVEEYLNARGIRTTVVAYGESSPEAPDGSFDIAFVLGGDGSVLSSARIMAPLGVPLFPINMGRLGFLAEISWDEWKDCFELYLAGKLAPVQRLMLQVEVLRGGKPTALFNALNDGAVTGSGKAKLLSFRARVSPRGPGSTYEDLGDYRADGILISSPTGSTAYSLAAGGPILSPEMDALIFNPICPFTLSNRPVVVPGNRCVEIDLTDNKRPDCLLTLDGQDSFPLKQGDVLRFSAAPYQAAILPSGRLSFYDVLRTKLSWSGGPDA